MQDAGGITFGDPQLIRGPKSARSVSLRSPFFFLSGRIQAKRLMRPPKNKNALETKALRFDFSSDPAGIFYRLINR
jgi:hypothetical protein